MVLARSTRLSWGGWSVAGLALVLSACGSSSTGPRTPRDANRRSVEVVHEACDTGSSQAQKTDANGDGKPELIVVMKGGRMVCQSMDLNLDGTVDRYAYYDGAGQLRRTESDYDRDGKIDEIALYQNGVIVEKDREMNLDGKLDTWLFFENGTAVRQERDTDGDGRVDEWWQFNGKKDETGALCAVVSRDIDGDGLPEPSSQIDSCQQDTGGVVPGAMPNYPTTAPAASGSAAPAATMSPPPASPSSMPAPAMSSSPAPATSR